MPKELKLKIQPHVIDHLGIKMYQKVADVVSEFVSNAWDADAPRVDIQIGKNGIAIVDNGVGMSFDECQKKFLTVGRDRRKTEKTDHTQGGRPVLGRKGIGKFAGFGIAKQIDVQTICKSTGELTAFRLDVQKILSVEDGEADIEILDYRKPSSKSALKCGTKVLLNGLNVGPADCAALGKELSRRFLLATQNAGFKILINGKKIPESFSESMEYVFPRDLTQKELADCHVAKVEDGWAVETFPNGTEIKWRVGFAKKPLDDEELRGIAIFARGKLAQKPFFFDFTGGMSAQQGLEYLTGQVKMEFIDDEKNDLIATERQRINLQTDIGRNIREWGIGLLRFLCGCWAARRVQKKIAIINSKTEPFSERLENFSKTERKTVMKVLEKIAGFERLGETRFKDWANDIITSFEHGRLRTIIDQLAETKDVDEAEFINILAESDVLASLNIAESVKTKILTIGGLKQRVKSRELENKVRDYIYKNPWIIHPKWEQFKKERSVENLIKDIGMKVFNNESRYKGRVDLALSAGEDLLLVEFMRPSLELDYDHLDRINRYVIEIRDALKARTGEKIRTMTHAYVVADKRVDSGAMNKRIEQLEDDNIMVLTWDGLIANALSQWGDTLALLKSHHPDDKRISCL